MGGTATCTPGAHKPSTWNGATRKVHVLHHFARQPAPHPHLHPQQHGHRHRCLLPLLRRFLGVVCPPWRGSTLIQPCMDQFARHRSKETYALLQCVGGRQALHSEALEAIVSWALRLSRPKLMWTVTSCSRMETGSCEPETNAVRCISFVDICC